MEIIGIIGIIVSILVAIAVFLLLYYFLGTSKQEPTVIEKPESTSAYVKIEEENRKLRRTVKRMMGMLTKSNGTKKRELTGIVDQLIEESKTNDKDNTDNPWSSTWTFKSFNQPWGDAVSPTSAWGQNTLDVDYTGGQSDSERPTNKNFERDLRQVGLNHDN